MKSYAESKIFNPSERYNWRRATELVAAIPDDGTVWRCHEVARAVGARLKLPVRDGKCGAVQHSWLLSCGHMQGEPKILDPYVPGAMPPVQLIDTFALLHFKYTVGEERDDIRQDDIERIQAYWSRAGFDPIPF